jgi:hypothetical protein
MKLLSVITMMTVLPSHSAFGNKLHFENVEVSTSASTDISNDGLDEERMRGSFRDDFTLPSTGSLVVPSAPWILLGLQIWHSSRKARPSTVPDPPPALFRRRKAHFASDCHGGLCLTSRPDPLDHGACCRQPSSSCSGLCIPPISL